MTIGERIKELRKLRGLTQKQLGIAVGFDEKNADIRIAQYESGTRTPKADMISKLANALNAHVLTIMNERPVSPITSIIFDLIDMEETADITLYPIDDKHCKYAISIDNFLFNDFLNELVNIRTELTEGKITYEEFLDWKVNWPLSSGDKPKYKWRR